MKILLVITNLDTGGAQRQIVNLGIGLKKRGHNVELWTYYPEDFFSGIIQASGIPVSCSLKISRLTFQPVIDLRKKIIEGDFEAVLSFLETPCVYAELACIGLRGVRLIVSERNGFPSRRASCSQLVKGVLHLLSSRVVTNSHTHSEALGARFFWLESRTLTIWNGVDTGAFVPKKRRKRDGVLRLIGVGRISPQKNLLRLIDALAICRQSGIPVTVEWAGKTDTPSYYEKAVEALEGNGSKDMWVWLGEVRDVPSLLTRFDALILPSLWEGLPNAICEGLASGLPILASNVADNKLLVADGERGFVFDPCDVMSIVSAITRLATLDINGYDQMCVSARKFAVKELSLDECVTQYEQVLRGNS